MRLSVRVTDRDGQRVPINGGSLAFTVANSVKSTGTISVRGTRDWLHERVTIAARIDGRPLPLGVYVPTAPDESYTLTGAAYDVELADLTALLHQARFGYTYAVEAGVDPIEKVIEIIGGTAPVIADDNTETLASPMFWTPSEENTKLRIVNDLLEAAGYFSLWADGLGNLRLQRYVRPQDRPVMGSFPYGRVKKSTNAFRIVNKVIAVGEAEPDVEPLIGVAELRGDSPYSIENLGERSHVEENVQATSQAVLTDYAHRRLDDLSIEMVTHVVEHTHRPIALNEIYTVREVAAVVQRIEIPLTLAKCRTTLREVAA